MIRHQPWLGGARCAETDPELFFPQKQGRSREAKQARSICAACEVQTPCLDWAVRNYEVGIWAGTSDNQRRQLRRQQRTAS